MNVLADDLAVALDPVRFSRRAGIEPDPWQAQLLRSPSKRILLNCSRQSGKSTTTATLALHTAVYQPGTLTLLLSSSLRQSGELFKKCTAVYDALGRPVPSQSETALTLTLENGSRIVSLPGKDGTVRGYSSVSLLVIDEASRVGDTLYRGVRPMLAVSGGRLLALSTPWGKRGWWYQEWTDGGPGWERYEVPATQCPRISPGFLEEERTSMGPLWFASEYNCEFVDTIDQVFRSEDIDAALDDDLAPLFPLGGLG